jgi:hypothetical protein
VIWCALTELLGLRRGEITMSATTIPAGRTLHLIDIENLLGSPRVTGPQVAAAYERALAAGAYREGDLVYVAANPWMWRELAFAPHTPCRMLIAHGEDGADLALLAQAAPEWVVKRFDRLVIGSGDGIFAARAEAIADLGVEVEVVCGVGHMSKKLRRFDASTMSLAA